MKRSHILIAGLALIAVTNTVALVGVVYNRSGEPESVLRFSERELLPPYVWRGNRENSGLALKLQWRVLQEETTGGELHGWSFAGNGGTPAWLDKAKMAELGFDVPVPGTATKEHFQFERQLPRDVLLALELDGAAYRESFARATRYASRGDEGKKLLEQETLYNSRLFVVDADLDAAVLRAKYPDRARYAIMRGQIRPSWLHTQPEKYFGYISDVSVDQVNVPLELRSVFEGAGTDYQTFARHKTKYEVTTAYGKRLEPWITTAVRK